MFVRCIGCIELIPCYRCRFVTDATVSLFVAVLLFILPSEPPQFLCCWRSTDTGDTHILVDDAHTGKTRTRVTHPPTCLQANVCKMWSLLVQSEAPVSQDPAPPLLTWQVTQKKMPWNIIVLLGGGFALAKGSEVCVCV